MRRYRVFQTDFDTRAVILKRDFPGPPSDHWIANSARIKQGLIEQYGAASSEQKIANFIELGPSPFSLLAFHNVFFRQARDAFVMGAYYPALAATCALGERVLNHLVLTLRDDFAGTRDYREMSRKESFDKWDRVIDALAAWGVLLPAAVVLFRKLKQLRTGAIHFRVETELATRVHALEALTVFSQLIEAQFSAINAALPWYFLAHGVLFVRKEAEQLPFVRRIVLPNCVPVYPKHRVSFTPQGAWDIERAPTPTDAEPQISDEEFEELHLAWIAEMSAAHAASTPSTPRAG